MLILRIFCLVTLILLSRSIATAQSRSFDCADRPAIEVSEAENVVGKVQDEYSKVRTLSGRFFQDSFNAALEISETATGRFFFQKPGQMRWTYESPKRQDFITKDKTVWLYQEDDHQVLIDRFDSVLISDLPIAFLMGLGDLRSDFRVIDACRGSDGIVVNLRPQKAGDAEKGLSGFKLLIGPGSYLPRGASVSDVGGNETAIVLSGTEVNASIPSSTFVPSFPQGVDIQDRRLEKSGRN